MTTHKSLKAMAADPADPQVKKTDLWKVDPRRLIEIDGFNLRDYDDPDVIAQIQAFADAYAADDARAGRHPDHGRAGGRRTASRGASLHQNRRGRDQGSCAAS